MSHMRLFLFGYYIFFCWIFALKVVRGYEFWTHLKMCVITFHQLPLTLNNGTGNSEMGSQVALMPVVIKFDQSD